MRIRITITNITNNINCKTKTVSQRVILNLILARDLLLRLLDLETKFQLLLFIIPI